MRGFFQFWMPIWRSRTTVPRWIQWCWFSFFCIWLVLLSGGLEQLTHSSGFYQFFQMHSLLETRKARYFEMMAENHELWKEKTALEKDPEYQEHEIRRVLGYVRKGEMVFDFTGSPF